MYSYTHVDTHIRMYSYNVQVIIYACPHIRICRYSYTHVLICACAGTGVHGFGGLGIYAGSGHLDSESQPSSSPPN